ncbi:MAG: bis(5'-nucleosyl)-tetraphosphatase (symmetrical) YqeK [Mycobacterium leprae]
MVDVLAQLTDGFAPNGNLAEDVPALFKRHGQDGLAIHVTLVAEQIERIAAQFGIDRTAALQAAWLHDVSRILPKSAMVEVAEQYGVEVLPEERVHPSILHGKLSALIADRVFHVSDPAVLDAMRCHTTLRPNATALDKALFVADKLSWHPDDAPFRADLAAALTRSLDEAAWCFMNWLWQQPMPVVHPWARAARAELAERVGVSLA